MSRIPPAVVQAIYERCGGTCEMDMGHLPYNAEPWLTTGRMAFHHRQARGMGGSKGRQQDTTQNLLYLHSECHEYIHRHPDWAREFGYIISQYAETP